MGLNTAVKHLFRDSIRIEPYNAGQVDVEGNPAYASSYFRNGRLVRKPMMIRDTEGREVVSMSRIFIDEGARQIDPQDRITLPDGSQPSIMAVFRATDAGGEFVATIFLEG